MFGTAQNIRVPCTSVTKHLDRKSLNAFCLSCHFERLKAKPIAGENQFEYKQIEVEENVTIVNQQKPKSNTEFFLNR